MNDAEKMLVKQFLLKVRQEGYSIVPNLPQSVASEINMDIYRGNTKICTFDDQQLGEGWYLQVRTDDSLREEVKADYYKLHDTFIHLGDLYMLYADAEPLQGYDQSLGCRAIAQYNKCTLAVRGGNILGAIEFGTFITGRSRFGNYKTIEWNTYFDMDSYPLAKLDFVARSGLLQREQLITPTNLKYLHGSCSKVMEREGRLFDEDTKVALKQTVNGLEKAGDIYREVEYHTSEMSAKIPAYIEAEILGVKGISTKHQIDRTTVPNELFAYDIQYSRDQMIPEMIWQSVVGADSEQ